GEAVHVVLAPVINVQCLAARNHLEKWLWTAGRMVGLAGVSNYKHGEVARPSVALFLSSKRRSCLKSNKQIARLVLHVLFFAHLNHSKDPVEKPVFELWAEFLEFLPAPRRLGDEERRIDNLLDTHLDIRE